VVLFELAETSGLGVANHKDYNLLGIVADLCDNAFRCRI
jgi:hypothetical protein